MDYSQIIAYWTSLCLSCAPNVHPATTAAIITIESKGNPYAIGDNTTHKSYSPRNKAEAVKLAQNLINQKHSIDIGLMQVNSTHIKPMHLSLNGLFESCYNINVGSRILTDFYQKNISSSKTPQETLLKAISSYNTGNAFRGYYNGYVSKVLRSVNYAFMVTPAQQTFSVVEPEKNETNTSSQDEPANKTNQVAFEQSTTIIDPNAVQTETTTFFKKPAKTN